MVMWNLALQFFRTVRNKGATGHQTRLHVAEIKFHHLLVFVVTKGEAAQPLRAPKHVTNSDPERCRVLQRFTQSHAPAAPSKGKGGLQSHDGYAGTGQ